MCLLVGSFNFLFASKFQTCLSESCLWRNGPYLLVDGF